MKKMRKLIPAFAMLMVAAIMMTTASFAWFTMNEQVTATGMNIQAQASGSLVISSTPLQSATAAPSVNFGTAVTQLAPITLEVSDEDAQGTPLADGAKRGVWKKPFATTEQPSVVNPTLGTPDYRGMMEVPAESYHQEIIYIGTSGESALSGGTITVSLGATASSADTLATKAYAVAVYIVGVANETKDNTAATGWTDTVTTPGANAEPDMILHVDNTRVGEGDAAYNRNSITIDLPTDVTIPSILGYGEGNNNGTGLKVVLRFFVDGALTTVGTEATAVKSVAAGYTYTSVPASTTYVESASYWIKGNYVAVTEDERLEAAAGKTPYGWFVLTDTADLTDGTIGDSDVEEVTVGTDIDKDTAYYKIEYREATSADLNGATVVPTTWYTRTAQNKTYNFHYVNNDTIPSIGTNLTVSFKHTPAST